MALSIPENQKKAVERLARLEQPVFEQLEAALRRSKPAISHRDLAASIATEVDLPLQDLTSILLVLVSLELTSQRTKKKYDDLVREIGVAASKQQLEVPGEGESGIAGLTTRLLRLLSIPRTIEITTKANSIYFAHQNLYHSARVLSDIRTVFTEGESLTPSAGLVVHNLEIEIHRDSGHKTHYYALNGHDLRQLRRVVDRAIAKESVLAEFIEKNSMIHIEDAPNEGQK